MKAVVILLIIPCAASFAAFAAERLLWGLAGN